MRLSILSYMQTIIKELLGHNNIKTTEIYTHIMDVSKNKIKSPLDFL